VGGPEEVACFGESLTGSKGFLKIGGVPRKKVGEEKTEKIRKPRFPEKFMGPEKRTKKMGTQNTIEA